MKKHIAKPTHKWEGGKKTVIGYKTYCGLKASSLEEATSKGFMSGVDAKKPSACKRCVEVSENNRYWKEYRKVSATKRRYV